MTNSNLVPSSDFNHSQISSSASATILKSYQGFFAQLYNSFRTLPSVLSNTGINTGTVIVRFNTRYKIVSVSFVNKRALSTCLSTFSHLYTALSSQPRIKRMAGKRRGGPIVGPSQRCARCKTVKPISDFSLRKVGTGMAKCCDKCRNYVPKRRSDNENKDDKDGDDDDDDSSTDESSQDGGVREEGEGSAKENSKSKEQSQAKQKTGRSVITKN
ncbi:hypothetical protein PVAG01_11323 [Phlyctema vagabunda]|uniref:Uncharacterized protein n=1 Tax=Phlyctema vagabunda TaxID=108571 RepID=A0ABR4P1Z8_9HELO